MTRKSLFNFFLPSILFAFFLSVIHWRYKLDLLFLWAGLGLGQLLWQVDHLLYIFVKAPHEYTSQRVMRFLQNRQARQALELLVETKDERPRTLFCSVLFQGFLFVVAFFVLTSSSSVLGAGLVFGLLFQTLYRQGQEFLKKGEIASWFWQLKTRPSRNLQALYFGFLVLVFVFFSLFLV